MRVELNSLRLYPIGLYSSVMTPEERFERIEANLERVTEAHLELGAAQLSGQKAHNRLIDEMREVGEKLGNLTILVNQLIARDLGRG